jgi:ribosomal protein RSM22 (predicted rRNA methylase)
MVPTELAGGIEAALEGVSTKSLAQHAQALSARYRGDARGDRRMVRSESDVLSYLAYRMPATYAAVEAALAATAERRPDFQPATLLDIGAGPGTAMWAATAVWPSVESVVLVESDLRMIGVGKRLAQSAPHAAIRDARWLAADAAGDPALPESDLVVAAYSLGELAPVRLTETVERLWSRCRDTFVVVEPGTPRGFATVRGIRDVLRAQGASTLAPCPHDDACPMAEGRWCHVSVRLERNRTHRAAKRSRLAYEDEKYSYVAMSRVPGPPVAARVIGHPRTQPGRIALDLCTPDGLRHTIVGRRDGDRYRDAHRARWGSILDIPLAAE